MTLITRLRVDLCQQPSYIPDQCKMLLKLRPNKSSFVLMSDKNDARYRFKIHSCTLLARRIKLVEATKLALQTTIETMTNDYSKDQAVVTYIQYKTALTYHYPKRNVLEYGRSTVPLDI